jgi:hypothetical protein
MYRAEMISTLGELTEMTFCAAWTRTNINARSAALGKSLLHSDKKVL